MNGTMFYMLMAKQREVPKRREKGVWERGLLLLICSGGGGGVAEDMDFLELSFELPIINKGLFPFRHKLGLELLGELHHL